MVIATYSDVARATCLHKSTVRGTILRYHRLGNRYDHDAFRRGGIGRKIPANIEAELVSWEMLNEMRFFSLDRRLEIIHSRYGVRISRQTLQQLYARNGVSFR